MTLYSIRCDLMSQLRKFGSFRDNKCDSPVCKYCLEKVNSLEVLHDAALCTDFVVKYATYTLVHVMAYECHRVYMDQFNRSPHLCVDEWDMNRVDGYIKIANRHIHRNKPIPKSVKRQFVFFITLYRKVLKPPQWRV